MLSRMLATVGAAAPKSPDPAEPPAVETGVDNATNIFTGIFDAIGDNGYQTGAARWASWAT